VPSFQAQVRPLLQARCGGCHLAGGTAAERLLDTWVQVYPQRISVLNQVYACWMPPAAGAGALTSAERALLLGWLVCGAPDS
jgi:uncharacterized membrane protein